jgi:phosphoesterase RecJ-like protein
MSQPSFLEIPRVRADAIHRIADALKGVTTVAVTTHINADGDAAGSVAAMARLLPQLGLKPIIVNPTPWPAVFAFLKKGLDDRTSGGAEALRSAGALISLDVSDVKRLGSLSGAARALPGSRIVIDHHVPTEEPAGDIVLADTAACATGELVFDLATVLGLEITPPVARALYAALLTDTGGFRFSNTTPRCHAIAGQLLAAGVDPEEMYRRIYASVSVGRLELLRDALATLETEPELGLSWISVAPDALERYRLKAEDLDGIVEHPRSISGTKLALFFRDLGYGKVKVSFRSTGDVDVNRFARTFGGGGHAKAAGALIAGSMDDVKQRVLKAAREYVRQGSAK